MRSLLRNSFFSKESYFLVFMAIIWLPIFSFTAPERDFLLADDTPDPPVAVKQTNGFCSNTDASGSERELLVEQPSSGKVVWVLVTAPGGSAYSTDEEFEKGEDNDEFSVKNNKGKKLAMKKTPMNGTDTIYGEYEFKVKVRFDGSESTEVTGFKIYVNETPVAPTAVTQTNSFCSSIDALAVNRRLEVTEPTLGKVVWILVSAPAGSAHSVGDEFRKDDANSEFQVKNNRGKRLVMEKVPSNGGTNIYGDYEFKVKVETDSCESTELTGFKITVNETPVAPTAVTQTNSFCSSIDALAVNRRLEVTEPTLGKVVWILVSAPAGSAHSVGDEFRKDDANSEFQVKNNRGKRLVMEKVPSNGGTNIYGDYEFKVKVETDSCESTELTGFKVTVNQNPTAPTGGSMTNTVTKCYALQPGTTSTGVTVTSTLTMDEKVVWKLTAAPAGSTHTVGDEFTMDNCGESYKWYPELSVTNFSGGPNVIRLQFPSGGLSSVLVGQYTFDAYIENCVTGCRSLATSGFSITVQEDTENPVISGTPSDITQTNDTGICGAVVTWTAPTPTDNCEVSMTSTHNPGATFSVGMTTVTYTAVDSAGNSAMESFTVTITDDEDPVITCPSNISQSNDTGDCSAIITYTAPVGTDNCTGQTTALTAGNGSGASFPVGTTTETYTVTDAAGNTASCSFTVTITDDEDPVITCPSNISQSNDTGDCSAVITYTAPVGTDNCTGQTTALTAGNGSGASFPVGTTTETYTVTDAAGNTASCSFTVTITDDEDPIPVCTDKTVVFNGEDQIAVSIAEIYDAAASSDNCGTVNLISPTADQMTFCNQIDEVIQVEVLVNDGNGNEGTCTANITVDGLPCGWMDDGGIGCTAGETEYVAATETFSLTSGDCQLGSYPYTTDNISFVYHDLSGDGTIKAYVENMSGNGFAGIQMRESTAEDARKIMIGTNEVIQNYGFFYNKIVRAARISPGWGAFPTELNSFPARLWLKIERSGDNFRAYASTDDITYVPYLAQSIKMDEDIKVGLFVYSKDGNEVSADFIDVEIIESTPFLEAPETDMANGSSMSNPLDVGLFPNPAKEEVSVNLTSLIGQGVNINIYNIHGQLMVNRRIDYVEDTREVFTLDRFPAGTYWVQIQTAEGQQSIKLLKQ